MVHTFRADINCYVTAQFGEHAHARTSARPSQDSFGKQFTRANLALMRRLAARDFGNNRVPTILHIGGRRNAINLKLRATRQH